MIERSSHNLRPDDVMTPDRLDSEGAPSSPRRLPDEPTFSKADIRGAERVTVNGEALFIVFTVVEGQAGRPDEHEGVDLRCMVPRLRGSVYRGLREKLGRRYRPERVVFSNASISVTVYAHDVVVRSLLARAGASWVHRVGGAVEFTRQSVRDCLAELISSPDVLVDASWVPGRDVALRGVAVETDSPDGCLQEQLEYIGRLEAGVSRRKWATGLVAIVLALLAGVMASLLGFSFGLYTLTYSGLFATLALLATNEQAELRGEIREAAAMLDLRGLLSQEERRSYKLFRLSSLEVNRYYDQGLRQRQFVFVIGVGCIIAGFAAVGTSFWVLYKAQGAPLPEKPAVSALGAISAILANFVAVIFLRMFSEIVKSVVEFHSRLVLTHHAHFADVLAAKIHDVPLRNQTLSKMAIELSAIDKPLQTEGERASQILPKSAGE